MSHLFESKKMTDDKITGNKTSFTLYLLLFTNFFIAAGYNVRQDLFPQCHIFFSWDMIFHNPKKKIRLFSEQMFKALPGVLWKPKGGT